MGKKVIEHTIVTHILKYINGLPRCRAKKVHGGSYMAGWPDVLCCIAGKLVFFEVKQPGLDATAIQRRELGMWAQAGAVTAVVHSLSEAKETLKSYGLIR